MQKCSICEKPIYGHPTPVDQTTRVAGQSVTAQANVVCGSCTLSKMQGGSSGKSMFEVRLGMSKLVTQQVPVSQGSNMTDLKVKSNVKNRTILLDGRFPVVFDAEGFGKVPVHLRDFLEREMIHKPGRYSILVEDAIASVDVPVVSEVEPVATVTEPVATIEAPLATTELLSTDEKVEEVPAVIDQSFLTEEIAEKPKKASKKK